MSNYKGHLHCWEQEQPPACGKATHKQCCLCDQRLNCEKCGGEFLGECYCPSRSETSYFGTSHATEAPLTTPTPLLTNESWEEEFRTRWEYDTTVEGYYHELLSFIKTLLSKERAGYLYLGMMYGEELYVKTDKPETVTTILRWLTTSESRARKQLIEEVKEWAESQTKKHHEFECGRENYEDFCTKQDCPRFDGRHYNKALEDLIRFLNSLTNTTQGE